MISLWIHSLLPNVVAFVRYLTFTGTAWRCGSFHYWRNTTNVTCSWFCTRLLEFSLMSLCKNSFSSSNARLHSSILKEKDAISRSSHWEMFCKKGVLMWTLFDLFCTKRLFSQETVFSPYYFTRDKNSFVFQWISYSRPINQVKTGALCRILNYWTEHLIN